MQKINTIYGFSKSNVAHNQYRDQSILTASPGDLVTMLYEAAIKNVNFTRIAINDENIELKNKHAKKAQEIIDELIKGLDFSYDMSYDLLKLYDFVNQQIADANINKDINKLQVAEEILSEMKLTWVQALKLSRTTLQTAAK